LFHVVAGGLIINRITIFHEFVSTHSSSVYCS